MRASVGNSGRNGQLRLRARTRFTPEFQPRPDAFRALADARQSPVPLARACLQDLAVDALSIIANSQPQELAVVGDFGLDAAGVRVVKGVSQDLARDPEDLVLKNWRQTPRPPFYNDPECRRFTVRSGGSRELLSRGRKQILQIARQRRVGSQALNGITAFG